jgi:hypothetical protein
MVTPWGRKDSGGGLAAKLEYLGEYRHGEGPVELIEARLVDELTVPEGWQTILCHQSRRRRLSATLRFSHQA